MDGSTTTAAALMLLGYPTIDSRFFVRPTARNPFPLMYGTEKCDLNKRMVDRMGELVGTTIEKHLVVAGTGVKQRLTVTSG